MVRAALRLAVVALGLVAASGQVHADGLERFEREVLPKLKRGAITYESASSAGPSGFVLQNVVVNPMGQDGAHGGVYRIARVAVEDLDFEGVAASGTARFAKLQLSGAKIPESADYAGFLRRYGVLPSSVDLKLEYRFDPATQTLRLSQLDLLAPGLARIAGDLVLEGVRPPILAQGRLVGDAAIRSARLTYDDQSALNRALRATGSRSGKSAEAVEREWLMSLGVIGQGRGPQTTAALDAVASLIEDHRKPKGPLRLTLHPPRAMPVGVIATMMIAADFAKSVGLSISYPGARANAAAGALRR